MLVAPQIAKRATAVTCTPAIALERPEKEKLLPGMYVKHKCYATPGNPDTPVYEIQLPYFGSGTPEDWLVFRDLLVKVLTGQNITDGPGRYQLTERSLIGDALAAFRLKTVEYGARTAANFQSVLEALTAHIFPVHAYREQRRYLRRFLKKPKDWTAREFVTRVQEINDYLKLFPTENDNEATSLPEDELVEALYHAMPSSWRNNMVLHGFNYVQHTVQDLIHQCERFEQVENDSKPAKKGSSSSSSTSTSSKKGKAGKRKRVVFAEESDTEDSRKYCLVHGFCSHTTNECKDLKHAASDIKKKKKANKTKYPHSARKSHGKTGSYSSRKGYVHKDEMNALVQKQVKKLLKKSRKSESVHAIDKFSDMSISSDEESQKSASSNSCSDSDSE